MVVREGGAGMRRGGEKRGDKRERGREGKEDKNE